MVGGGESMVSNSLLMGYSKTICRLFILHVNDTHIHIHRGQICTTFDDLVILVPVEAA